MAPPYVSPLREAQAAETRRRILDAAVAVFGESGYSGTTLPRIARAAGVSVETVKLSGPKSALLLAAFDHAFTGEEGDGRPLHERGLGGAAQTVPTGELLGFLLDFIAAANARVALLWPRVLDAASGDVDVAARVALLQSNRRKDMRALVALLREQGLCRSARPDEDLADACSFLVSPEGYTQFVIDAGWTPAAYRAWLQRAVEALVLAA